MLESFMIKSILNYKTYWRCRHETSIRNNFSIVVYTHIHTRPQLETKEEKEKQKKLRINFFLPADF